jgi:hypothetical protein
MRLPAIALIIVICTILLGLHLANKLGEEFASRVETRMQMHNL